MSAQDIVHPKLPKPASGTNRYRCSLLLIVTVGTLLVGCAGERPYPNRPLLLVCPWAAGGGTDRVSRTLAAHLERALGQSVNVINATGGKGVTGHSRGLKARPDGYTLLMATLELNMMHWSDLTDLTMDDCIPLMSLNEDYAALFVRADSPWQTLPELEAEIRRAPQTLQSSGTSTGGAWHVALAGWLTAADLAPDDVVWISSTGAGPSLQELISGGLDMVCCALPEASSLFEAGEIRCLGVMGPTRAQGYESVPTFREQGRDWTLGGWRAVVVPLETPTAVCEMLQDALSKIVAGETSVDETSFPEFMETSGFDHTTRRGDELLKFLRETDQKFGALLTSPAMRSVNRDRYDRMTFPRALMVLLGFVSVAIAVTSLRTAAPASSDTTETAGPRATRIGMVTFVALAVSIVLYVVLAEVVGFVLLSGVLLLLLMLMLGTRVGVAMPLAVLLPVAIYQLFALLLKVPLPRGWLGW